MTNEPEAKLQRIDELLAERAALALSPEEELELAQLLAGSSVDPSAFDIVAARTALAFHPAPFEPLPQHLRDRIASAAMDQLAQPGEPAPRPRPVSSVEPPRPGFVRNRNREIAAWILAAACLLIAAVSLWNNRPTAPLPPAEERARLLASAPDIVEASWTAAGDPTGKQAAGDIVWSDARQTGYMRFHGLAANDPTVDVYQLWIFDANQDPRYPIDGGVFDVSRSSIDRATGDLIVPMHAEIPVSSPQMFAVTVEKPGGVVVSSRARIAVLAKVGPRG